jgi:hypothetical protein
MAALEDAKILFLVLGLFTTHSPVSCRDLASRPGDDLGSVVH